MLMWACCPEDPCCSAGYTHAFHPPFECVFFFWRAGAFRLQLNTRMRNCKHNYHCEFFFKIHTFGTYLCQDNGRYVLQGHVLVTLLPVNKQYLEIFSPPLLLVQYCFWIPVLERAAVLLPVNIPCTKTTKHSGILQEARHQFH